MKYEGSSIVETRRHRYWVGAFLFCWLLLGAAFAYGQDHEAEEPKEGSLAPASWLVLGPQPLPLPAFHDRASGSFGAKELLGQSWKGLEDHWPAAGVTVAWVGGGELTWKERAAPVALERSEKAPVAALFATFLEAESFTQAKLRLETTALAEVYLDGESVGSRKDASADETFSAELTLTPGKHLLLVELVLPPGLESDGAVEPVTLTASLEEAPEGETAPDPADPEAHTAGVVLEGVRFSTDPAHGLRLVDVLEAPSVSGLDLSPDGAHLAIHLQQPVAQPAEGGESWTEILRVKDGRPVLSLRGGETGFAWAPDSRRFSYVKARQGEGEEGLSDLWISDLGENRPRRLLQGVKDLGAARWLPDGASILYQVSEKEEADPRGVKRYRGLNDRWGGFRDRGHLHQVVVESGLRRRLTAGPDGITFLDIRPDGKQILFSINRYEPTVWPYTRDDLFELDLGALEARRLTSIPWFRGAVYDRSGDGVLVLAGPASFGNEGLASEALRSGASQPNGYDTQLYRWSLSGDGATALTRSFDPTVEELAWSGETLLLRSQVEDRFGLYRRGPGDGEPVALSTGVENVEGVDGDETGETLAYIGSSVDRSQTVFVLSPKGAGRGGSAPRALYRATPELEERLRLGTVEEWSFPSGGDEIQGRLHLPPDFDAEETYPLIVYYYGGTVPTERTFADRYPFHVWTAQGYVVYVLQPSGATGYGQDFSARHVNNWGQTVADEILRGTEAVLEAHPYLDRRRVGCIGASYGGFMTMHLLTRTELFAGAVAHAGISSISSYWGEGNWGYLYSAQASARSFPWSHRELFVDQSPLFAADRITTPLLLLHGTADTNVPIGESQQMYTALEMLGKEVELVTFEGENHRIVSREKREVWSETILAWFAWKLKGQPQWWQHLYGSGEEPKG